LDYVDGSEREVDQGWMLVTLTWKGKLMPEHLQAVELNFGLP